MVRQLIISADDFGASDDVNAAVMRGCREGLLTSAGLMVTGTALRKAVEMAREDPRPAVGLHLTLSNGTSVLSRQAIDRLVDSRSRFRENPACAALRYYFDRKTHRQLRQEINAQFEAFAATGLKLSHVDGHQHLHAHPAVLPIVIELACKYGADGIRIPRDPVLANLRADRSGWPAKAVVALGHAYLARVCRRLLPMSGLATCDVTIGSLMSGRMNADYAVRMLERLDCRSVEIFFHPSITDAGVPFGPNPGDLRTILNPTLGSRIAELGFELSTYSGLKRKENVGELG